MGLFNFKKQEEKKKALYMDTVKMAAIEMPKPVETTTREWVLNGQNNCFANELVKLKNESGIHSAIIESVSRMTVGNGFMFAKTREKSEELFNGLDTVTQAKIQSFIEDINPTESVDSIMFKFIRDYKTFGYAGLEVIWNADYTRPIQLNYIDTMRLVTGKKEIVNINGQDCYEITHFWYSQDWKNTNKYTPIKIPVFNPENAKKNREGKQIIFIKNEANGLDYYGQPEYYSAINWIKCDSLMATLNLNNIENGFSPNVLMKFYHEATAEEQEATKSSIASQMRGIGQKIMFLFWPDKDTAPEVEPIAVENFNDRLVTLNDMIVQQIITAWRIQPTICGIQIPGKLGNSSNLAIDYNTFNATVIQPERKIFEKILTKMFKLNGFPFTIYFEDIDVMSGQDGSSLMEQLGKDGASAIANIVASTTLTNDQKIQLLIVVFGVDQKSAEDMVLGKTTIK